MHVPAVSPREVTGTAALQRGIPPDPGAVYKYLHGSGTFATHDHHLCFVSDGCEEFREVRQGVDHLQNSSV